MRIEKQNFDPNIIKKRYSFPGNLKLPINIIEQIPEKKLEEIFNFLNTVHSKIISIMDYKKDIFFKTPLSKDKSLCIDYKNGNLTLYISNSATKQYTQIMSLDDIIKFERKENNILNRLADYQQKEDVQIDKLEQNLIHTAIHTKTVLGRAPPVFGQTFDEDFELEDK